MILADKIISLRKKNGWSQEELAVKMDVSRQAVSKWESAQSTPDLEKVLSLSRLFGVTTDYLLKDEIEDEEFTDECGSASDVRRITLEQANEFLNWRKSASVKIAVATFLCIIAAIPLIILGAASEVPAYNISENLAAGIGLTVLFFIVAIAVAIFVFCGSKNTPYDFIDNEPFETEYGVSGMVKERKKAYSASYTRCNIIGACLCVISPIPLFVGAVTENDFFMAVMLAVTMILAGVGTVLLTICGVRQASMEKLLKEGDFTPKKKHENNIKSAFSTAYWLIVTAIYLVIGLSTDTWSSSYVIWPIAGILFAVVLILWDTFKDKVGK